MPLLRVAAILAAVTLLVACGAIAPEPGSVPADAAAIDATRDATVTTPPDAAIADSTRPEDARPTKEDAHAADAPAPRDAVVHDAVPETAVDGAPIDSAVADTALADVHVASDAGAADSLSPDAPLCVPQEDGCCAFTCASANAACGQWDNGCGGTLDCGSCAQPSYCQAWEGCPFDPVPNAQCSSFFAECPVTCAQQHVSCGPAGDGFGNVLQCGDCASPLICGGGGVHSVCGTRSDAGPCPTCADVGIQCGPVALCDGGVQSCGTCTVPATCGGGGVPGQCGVPACQRDAGPTCCPSTCKDYGVTCGAWPDGCGGTVFCGLCPSGQECSAEGSPGVCVMREP